MLSKKKTVIISGERVPKATIQKWCDALRSGEYKQTRDKLEDVNGFCCLGVACKVFIPEELQVKDINGCLVGYDPSSQGSRPNWLFNVVTDFEGKTHKTIPIYKQQSSGSNYMPQNENGYTGLIRLNDTLQLTFDEIADCIEAVYIHEVML